MVKELLKSSGVLVHLHERLPLLFSCDASPYGVGVVLAHRMPDGLEHLCLDLCLLQRRGILS